MNWPRLKPGHAGVKYDQHTQSDDSPALSPPSGMQLFSSPQEKHPSSQESRNDLYTTHTWQPTSRQIPDTHCQVETSVQHTFNSTETHGEFYFSELIKALQPQRADSFLLFCRNVGDQTRGTGAH